MLHISTSPSEHESISAHDIILYAIQNPSIVVPHPEPRMKYMYNRVLGMCLSVISLVNYFTMQHEREKWYAVLSLQTAIGSSNRTH